MAVSLSAHAEFFIFAAICTAAFGLQGFWLHQAKSAQLPWLVWTLAAGLLLITWRLAEQGGDRERHRIQKFTQDFARLYGSEMEKRGHWRLGGDVGADDPFYLELIETERRWLGLSPSVNDIYTLRKLPDGRNVFIVDSETDYDRDGKHEGERELRTTIGEVYGETIAALEQAFLGAPAFAFEPIADRWGTWVSAFVPLHAPDGGVEAVLGVDFEARAFAQTIAAAEWRVVGLMGVVQIVLLGASTLTSVMRADISERKRSAAELAKAHQSLVELSRQAGMAEVATGVLHNVGNVLNSVNVAATCVADGVRRSKLKRLTRAVTILREHEHDLAGFFSCDSRGAKLPEFLERLAGRLASEQSATLTELAHLQRNIEHIKDIVAAQQSYGKVSGVSEKLDVAELVEDTLRMSAETLARHRVQVVREFAPVPSVLVDKHKVLQILVNLVGNAKHACEAADRPDRTLTVRVFNGDDTVKVAVSDNGVGIPPENLLRIFNHGFTTKRTGHGFGLHSGAIAARELGGCLNVHSDGPGHGATFTLALPLNPS